MPPVLERVIAETLDEPALHPEFAGICYGGLDPALMRCAKSWIASRLSISPFVWSWLVTALLKRTHRLRTTRACETAVRNVFWIVADEYVNAVPRAGSNLSTALSNLRLTS